MERWPYYNGMRALNGAPGLKDAPVDSALALVQYDCERYMSTEDREEFDGWMTCTYSQALDFLALQAKHEQADRLSAARMINGGR